MTIVALGLLSFISALDVTIIATALPLITEEIGGARQYIWIANSFVFTSAVLQPLIGQLANILGRKSSLTSSILLFMIGSGLAGGAQNPAMLIAGRTVQGLGAGGIYVLIEIVCCDLVPLREREKYLAIVNVWAAVAAALGPVIGGILAEKQWRWIFYMNFPISAIQLLIVTFFMHVKTGRGSIKAPTLGLLWKLHFYYEYDLIVIRTSHWWRKISVVVLADHTTNHSWCLWLDFLPFPVTLFRRQSYCVYTLIFQSIIGCWVCFELPGGNLTSSIGIFSSSILPSCPRHYNFKIRCLLYSYDHRNTTLGNGWGHYS